MIILIAYWCYRSILISCTMCFLWNPSTTHSFVFHLTWPLMGKNRSRQSIMVGELLLFTCGEICPLSKAYSCVYVQTVIPEMRSKTVTEKWSRAMGHYFCADRRTDLRTWGRGSFTIFFFWPKACLFIICDVSDRSDSSPEPRIHIDFFPDDRSSLIDPYFFH